jgi:hypothetical protein
MLVAISLALLAAGSAWWASVDWLTAEESRMVGVWTFGDKSPDGWRATAEFRPDRRCWYPFDWGWHRAACHWSVRGGSLVLDLERSGVRRTLRPVAGLLGLSVRPAFTYALTVDSDHMVLTDPRGVTTHFTRTAAD